MSDEITPIRQQYLDIKKKYPGTIVFFRLGDFYETFDEDAETTSRELDIVLTSRGAYKGTRIPMAGIPYHAVENYLSRLIEKGYHVAICEQIGDQPSKGIFPRDVVRVVTPGTVFEPSLLKGDHNNYLAAIVMEDNKAGLAYVDISTGEFQTTQFESDNPLHELKSELIRIGPVETLLPESLNLGENSLGHLTRLPDWRFETGRSIETVKRLMQVSTLDGFGLINMSLSIQTVAVVLQYLQDTQSSALKLLSGITTYSTSEFMTLDSPTRRNLELTETIRKGESQGSLLSIMDMTLTPMGHRLVRQWVSKPLLNLDQIRQRQDAVSSFVTQGVMRIGFRESLAHLGDLERLANRVSSGNAIPRDLVALRETAGKLPGIMNSFSEIPESLSQLMASFDPVDAVLQILTQSIAEDPPATLQTTGVIRSGYSEELDHTIEMSRHAREWISNLEGVERERTGIKSLKVGFNKVFGYYLEVTHSNTQQVPPEYIRKQTLVNAERYITPEMKEYEALVLNAEERIREIEARLFREVCNSLLPYIPAMLRTAHCIAELDTLAGFAEVASLSNYIQPELSDSTRLEIIDGRHPVVETSLNSERFIANDCSFDEKEIVRIITGPNMSGKSTFLRQVALIVLMAQTGSFVPAKRAHIGLVDRIFTRIGAQDEIHAGQSTFMVEMIEAANILNHATPRSLIILDEIGRGTSTYDGLSIAWSVVEFIHNHPKLRSRTLFATHYHELTQLEELLPGVRNYNVAVTEAGNQVVFLHKIVAGGADRSYGIHVAQMAGIPRPVISRAGEILHQLEQTSGSAVKIEASATQQMSLFPETNPLLDELEKIDLNTLSPIEALNILYEWQQKYKKG